jgi:hypothetical protein
MKNKHNIMWQCAMPKCSNNTSTLHECFPGRMNRDYCIKYHIQVPLCPTCHYDVHHKKGMQIHYKKLFCLLLDIRYGDVLQALGTATNPLLRNVYYLESIQKQCYDKIMSLET